MNDNSAWWIRYVLVIVVIVPAVYPVLLLESLRKPSN